MTPAQLLRDAFERVRDTALTTVDGLSEEQLAHRPSPDANPIGWLVWHLTRVQDDHVAGVADLEQVWVSRGHLDRFGLGLDPRDIGYGHSREEVAGVRAPADRLADYLREVTEQTLAFVDGLCERDLDRVVDPDWEPPVTLGVRLLSVINDDLQHAGQAAYVRGLLAG